MERRKTELRLSEGALRGLLSVLEPGAEFVRASLLSGGLANTNYAIETHAGPDRVLRLVTRDPVSAAKEVRLLRLLRGKLPLPGLVASAPAHAVAGVKAPALLLERLRGETLEEALPRLDALGARDLGEGLGRALASLHAHEFDDEGDLRVEGEELQVQPWSFPGEDPGLPAAGPAALRYVTYCLDRTPCGARLGELKERVRAFVCAGIERWPAPTPCLVHGDFKPCNLFVEEVAGRWHLRGILDWEFAHAGSPYSDYGNLFRERAPRLPEGFEAGVEKGLAEAGVNLPRDWRLRRAHADLTSALDFLSSERDLPLRHAASLAQVRATLALPEAACGG